ncbi:hypothetical protein AcW1_002046 [Taiwanofungus camphoratus]|nr:hypothetical protein AcW1_002046 [Antrodia cinnamomea]
MSSSNDNAYIAQPPPEHHVHHSSDAIPGARGAEQSADYSTNVTNDSRTWTDENQRQFGTDDDTMASGQHDSAGGATPNAESGRNAYNEDRPLGVQPTSKGGVAVGGQEDLPEGHARVTDKLIGKTQKVVGKVTRNPEVHEKGELREAGGKAAAKGEARAPHD